MLLSLNGKAIYVTATGLKVTARGRVQAVSAFYAALSKGEARRVRKALRLAGHAHKAGQPRQVA